MGAMHMPAGVVIPSTISASNVERFNQSRSNLSESQQSNRFLSPRSNEALNQTSLNTNMREYQHSMRDIEGSRAPFDIEHATNSSYSERLVSSSEHSARSATMMPVANSTTSSSRSIMNFQRQKRSLRAQKESFRNKGYKKSSLGKSLKNLGSHQSMSDPEFRDKSSNNWHHQMQFRSVSNMGSQRIEGGGMSNYTSSGRFAPTSQYEIDHSNRMIGQSRRSPNRGGYHTSQQSRMRRSQRSLGRNQPRLHPQGSLRDILNDVNYDDFDDDSLNGYSLTG